MSSLGNVVVGVSGGVAAYKAAALVSQLAQAGVAIQVVMTETATTFVGAPTFAALSGRAVAQHLHDSRWPLGPHIELARWADLICIAPATANFLAKAASGVADDLLSTLYLAAECPIWAAPAMNSAMWRHPATQRNVKQLAEDGVRLVGPADGWLSCRVRGEGRMSEPDEIAQVVTEALQQLRHRQGEEAD
ncbi:MAG: phosphopantothenoylcysteine decarboxylase [Planctomycetales bacterium]|nr:phosphopantothenoylcysteine decarboxylase [Planctomycetales bacterium]